MQKNINYYHTIFYNILQITNTGGSSTTQNIFPENKHKPDAQRFTNNEPIINFNKQLRKVMTTMT